MNHSEKEKIRGLLKSSGAVAVGFAKALEIDPAAHKGYEEWLLEGNHAGMGWMEKHLELRKNPQNVLPGVKTVISLAFSFVPGENQNPLDPEVSCYALGKDYHEVIRKRLRPLLHDLKFYLGGDWRICIDSAPVAERYWALKAGIGRKGKNGMVIVEGCGNYCFLAEVLTTIDVPADEPSEMECIGCGECLKVCPGKAIKEGGEIDCRNCLSYLTIEHKGEIEDETGNKLMSEFKGKILFGCDRCLKICPHNKDLVPTEITEFRPMEALMSLNVEKLESMTEDEFKTIFKESPLKRAGLEKLKRNIGL